MLKPIEFILYCFNYNSNCFSLETGAAAATTEVEGFRISPNFYTTFALSRHGVVSFIGVLTRSFSWSVFLFGQPQKVHLLKN